MLICLIVMTIATVVLAFLYFGGQDSIEAASFIGGNGERKPIVDWHLKTGVSSPNNFVRSGVERGFSFVTNRGRRMTSRSMNPNSKYLAPSALAQPGKQNSHFKSNNARISGSRLMEEA